MEGKYRKINAKISGKISGKISAKITADFKSAVIFCRTARGACWSNQGRAKIRLSQSKKPKIT